MIWCWMGKSGNAVHMACNILNLYNEQHQKRNTKSTFYSYFVNNDFLWFLFIWYIYYSMKDKQSTYIFPSLSIKPRTERGNVWKKVRNERKRELYYLLSTLHYIYSFYRLLLHNIFQHCKSFVAFVYRIGKHILGTRHILT